MIELFAASFVSQYGLKGAVILTYMCSETKTGVKKNFTKLSIKNRFPFFSEKQVREALFTLLKGKGIEVSHSGEKGLAPRTIQYSITKMSLKQYACEAVNFKVHEES
jgi:hypothetical protein